MQPEQINYQPLKQLDNFGFDGSNIHTKQLMAMAKQHRKIVLSYGFLFVVVCTLVAVFSGVSNLAPVIFYGLFVTGFLLSYVLYRQFLTHEAVVWRQFATANKWQVHIEEEANALVPPFFTKIGHSHKSSELLTGQLDQASMGLFRHQYTLGYGKDSQVYPFTLLVFKINAKLPDMLIFGHRFSIPTETNLFKEKLRLEGDFNKYFKVFVQQDNEVDELSILTPDIMQFLMTSDTELAVATYNNRLYLIKDNDVRRFDKLPPFIDFGQKLYQEVMQNLPLAKSADISTSATQTTPSQSA